MIYNSYTIKELKNKLDDVDFWDTPILPITPYRAYSHIKNPRAHDNDICLIVAVDNQKVNGYIGILPDNIFINDQKEKVGVLSSWWVNEQSKWLGGLLLFQAMKAYNGSIIAMHYSKDANNVYEKSGLFVPLRDQKGKIFFNNINLKKRLIVKFNFIRYFGLFIEIIEKVISIIYSIPLILWKLRNARFNNFEYTNIVNKEIYDFVKQNRKTELFRRGIDSLNWLLNYKWVFNGPLNDRLSKRYRFSSVISKLEFFPIKLYNSKEMIGFVIIRIRNERITMPYIYYKKEGLKHIANLICYHIIELNAYSLELYHPDLIDEINKSKFPFIYKKVSKRKIIITKKYEHINFQKFQIQLGDGEGAYTY